MTRPRNPHMIIPILLAILVGGGLLFLIGDLLLARTTDHPAVVIDRIDRAYAPGAPGVGSESYAMVVRYVGGPLDGQIASVSTTPQVWAQAKPDVPVVVVRYVGLAVGGVRGVQMATAKGSP